jgi:putative phosphoribosyl transferase
MAFMFKNRTDAGRLLAERLKDYADRNDVTVLALPRGGVPVGYEVANALGVRLDILIVRKLGVPHHPELAMGAIASGGASYLNKDVIHYENVSRGDLDRTFNAESLELKRREREFRGNRPPVEIAGKVIIVVDDGIATGSTIYAAVKALRMRQPAQIIVAVPVAPRVAAGRILSVADHFVCLHSPAVFHAVGQFYEDFAQTSDDEVRALLSEPIHIHAAIA